MWLSTTQVVTHVHEHVDISGHYAWVAALLSILCRELVHSGWDGEIMDGWICVKLYRGAALLWGAPQSVVQLQCKSWSWPLVSIESTHNRNWFGFGCSKWSLISTEQSKDVTWNDGRHTLLYSERYFKLRSFDNIWNHFSLQHQDSHHNESCCEQYGPDKPWNVPHHNLIPQVFKLWWISATRTCNWIGTILTKLNIDIQLLFLLSRILQIGFWWWRDGTRRLFSLVASERAKEHANYSFFFGCSFYPFWTFLKIHCIK